MKAAEVGALREQTLTETRRRSPPPRPRCARRSTRGGKLLALGNGGSATDAMDVVADFRAPAGRGWPARRALDLTEDPAILTAIANDIGVEAIFARQVIAYGRAGDVAARALDERQLGERDRARSPRRGGAACVTIAMVGYDGGRIAAERLADHVVVTRSRAHPADPGGAGERVPRAARAGRGAS